jgi:hypothetical protein
MATDDEEPDRHVRGGLRRVRDVQRQQAVRRRLHERGDEEVRGLREHGGAAVASATPTATAISAARIGTPTNEYLYIANGADTIWRWTGAAFSQPAGMPIGTYLTAKTNSNRLVTANITGTSISRVQFSDAGAPETWTSTSFVDVAPGDGSEVTGLATWQNDVYAFKRNRFFVFGVESTDSTGKPVFNYRTVDGYGASVPPVAGLEGVYFFDGRYVWLTAGGIPRCISDPIDSFLSYRTALAAGSYDGQSRPTTVRLSYAKGRLYVSIPIVAGTSFATLVYDPRANAWTAYSTTLRYAADLNGYVYWLSDGGKANRFRWDTPSDDGAAIAWSYQSGFYDMGYPGQAKVVREARVWGTGDVSLRMYSDATIDLGTTLALGTPVQGPGVWQQIDREGTFFAHYLSGSSTATAEVHRIVYYPSQIKDAGIE